MPLIWKAEYAETVFIFMLFSATYLVHHFGLLDALLLKAMRAGESASQPVRVYTRRLSGALLLAAVPALGLRVFLRRGVFDYGFALSIAPVFWFAACGVCAALFPILLAYSRGKEAVRNAPEARPRRWSLASIAVNAGSWVIYLFAYELCMRGYLLFSLQRVMGSWPGIAVMTAVYTAVHLPKGKGEAAGSAVMGLVFGVLTVAARSIFPSLLIHACVSITVDMLVILRNRGEPQQP